MSEVTPSFELLVSVIIPVFNAAKTLDECLQSITKQQLVEFEVLLIDDGSSDNSVEICQHWHAQDSRIQLLSMSQNTGASAARNLGIRSARGKYICFVDADDWIEPEMFADMVRLAEKTNSELVCSSHIQNRGQGENKKVDGAPESDVLFDKASLLTYLVAYINTPYLYTLFVHCWGKLYRRSFVESDSLLFDERLSQLEDVHFNLRICYLAETISYKRGYYYHHRIQSGTMSSLSGTESDVVNKMRLAFSPVFELISSLDKEARHKADKLYNKLLINTLVITIIRLARRYLKKPELGYFRRIRSIVASEDVTQGIKDYRPNKGESHLLFYALRTGSPSLVAIAGVIRASVIALKK